MLFFLLPTLMYGQDDISLSSSASGHDRLNNELKNYSEKDQRIAVNRFLEGVDSSLALSSSIAMNGKNIWVSPALIHPNFYVNPRVYDVHDSILFNGDEGDYSVLGYYPEWLRQSRKVFWDSVIGGSEYSFYHLHCVGVTKRNSLANPRGSKNKRIFFVSFVPIPGTVFKHPYDKTLPYNSETIRDTLFVPFSEVFLERMMTDSEMEQFSSDFYESARNSWKQWSERMNSRYAMLEKLYGEEAAGIINGGRVRFGFTIEMCMLALEGEPYQISTNVSTPLGDATMYNFYTQDIRLYFINGVLIGIAWKGNALQYRT